MKNKKIGILTYHYSDNYGALLQTYSLSKLLERKGFEVEVINLVPHLNLFRKVKKVFKNPLTINFKKFREKHIKTNPKQSFTYKNISKVDFTQYYAIIVGSDQVWRKGYTEGLEYAYFLNFVPDKVKRISYAASFGLDYYEGNEHDKKIIKKELEKFDLITNREKSGVLICKELFQVKSHCVLDPVLLADNKTFNFNVKTNHPKAFVTQYLLDPSPKKINLISRIASNLDLPIYINFKQSNKKITLFNSIFKKNEETFPPVYDWISGIKNSDFVITDSFHGVAFSILFKKQFICIINEKRGKTRMLGLLEQLELTDYAISDDDTINQLSIENIKKIDYQHVTNILEKLKTNSISLLIDSLL